MTKAELVKELKKHGIEATTRARKATLERLLEDVTRPEEVNLFDKEGLTILAVTAVVIAVTAVIFGHL